MANDAPTFVAEVVTKGLGVVSADITAPHKDVQAWAVRVSSEMNDSQVHVIVLCPKCGSEHEINTLGEAIRKHFSATSAAFLIRDPPGEAEAVVVSDDDSVEATLSVVAAVAVTKRSCWWDETDPLQVLIAGQRFLASLVHGRRGWEVLIDERSAVA